MKTFIGNLSTATQSYPPSIYGPRLSGIWHKLTILAWGIFFITCAAGFFMSISYGDLWFRTPYTNIPHLAPELDIADLEENLKPFQDAIYDLGLTLDSYSHYFTALRLLAGIPYFILSFLILRHRSDRLMVTLFAIVLCLLGAAGTWFNPLWEWIPESYPWHPVLNMLFNSLLLCSVIILYTFPDGRFLPRWTLGLAALIVPYAAAINFISADSTFNPNNLLGGFAFIPNLVFLGGGVYALIYHYKTYANAVQKQQIKWFVVGSVLIVVNWLIDYAVWEVYPALTGDLLIQAGQPAVLWELFQDTFWYIAEFTLAACIAISIFRYRLWDIDLVINRILVYGSLTALTMLVYIGLVSAIGSLFDGIGEPPVFFLATGLVAILFEPLHQRLQRWVNRLMYGERDDPYAVLTRLSGALKSTSDPENILPALVIQIRQALKIPYAAIRLEQDGQQQLAAAHGEHLENLQSFPLVYQEEDIGSLLVALRAPGESFSKTDQRLLENIARQAGPAVQSVRLHNQLVRSRTQIVVEREDERRRIRRDLHDELGPILASQSLKLVAASRMIQTNPEQAKGLVDELALQSQETVQDIRRLVHGLRPPALDQLGLVEAVRDFARQRGSGILEDHEIVIEISAPPEGLPELSAAIEVNAYRIVLEALTNAMRHAQAETCKVTFQIETDASLGSQLEALVIHISDDGKGFTAGYHEGVGLRSMRERAEEIGGRVAIEPTDSDGTLIKVWLPVSH